MRIIYTNDHILETERHVKLFLAAFENVDTYFRDENMVPHWIAAYNIMCSLNLSGMMKDYGVLRNLYEGSLVDIFLVLVNPRTNGLHVRLDRCRNGK
jgi:hypothetical protein